MDEEKEFKPSHILKPERNWQNILHNSLIRSLSGPTDHKTRDPDKGSRKCKSIPLRNDLPVRYCGRINCVDDLERIGSNDAQKSQ